MTDREMLILAAKAGRVYIVPCTCSDPRFPFKFDPAVYKNEPGYTGHWNPLEHGAQALELASHTETCIEFGSCQESAPIVTCWPASEPEYKTSRGNFPDSRVATRRTIVESVAAAQLRYIEICGDD